MTDEEVKVLNFMADISFLDRVVSGKESVL